MISETAKKRLEKQGYRLVGDHSCVKVCGWTKNMIKGHGGCYKLKFYGIMSNQCLQMSTSMSCANRCSFCWRGYKSPVSETWDWPSDDPKMIFEESVKAHHKLLLGFNGNPKANRLVYDKSRTIKHAALSLTGEPIFYPKFNEFLDECNKNGVSTFVVTNAQYPKEIKDSKPITQLYISMDAPNKELLKELDKPLFKDYWQRYLDSIDALAEKKERTAVRITMVKGINDVDPEGYAKLIKRSNADFLEIKGYMFVGESRERLVEENMPDHEEVVEFARKVEEFLPDYELMQEHVPSRVVLLSHKKFKGENGKWNSWIDFEKWNELVNSGATEIDGMDYCAEVPTEIGISGKTTKDHLDKVRAEKQAKREKRLAEESKKELFEANETLEEKDLED